MDLVSIVVPVYNMGDKIRICVDSILKQTYSNLEIILVDDGSKDDSLEHCKEIQNIDHRVVVIHTENQGSGPARNEGIKVASGKYIYFPDADDYIEPNAIECMVNSANSTDCDLLVFGFNKVDASGKIISRKCYTTFVENAECIRQHYAEYLKDSGKKTIQGAPWNKFFRIEVIRKYNLTYPALRRHQDEGFIARYVDKATKVAFIENVLYTYYVNDLQRQWDKYPIDYVDAVEGLYKERQSNILLWNKDDIETHELVDNEYICNFIKSLELSFSNKFGFSRKDRIQWIKEKKRYSFQKVIVPKCTSTYQRFVKWLFDHNQWNVVYVVLYLKVLVDKIR